MDESKEQKEKSKDTDQIAKRDSKVRAYYLALKVIRLLDALPSVRSTNIIADQLLRSITSIGANIIEAQAASSRKDFINFINHSLKSANESKFWLGLIRDSGKYDKNKINELLQEVGELSKILGASIITAKGKRSL